MLGGTTAVVSVQGPVGLGSEMIGKDRLMTAPEIAELLRVEVATLAKWRVIGCGPKWLRLPNSRTIRYRRADIDVWLDGRTFQSTREADDAEPRC